MPQRETAVRPISRLTIATDFTSGAAMAAARAVLLPLAPRPRITLMHVLPRRVGPALQAREEAVARARLEYEAGRLGKALRRRDAKDARVRTVLARGEPFAEILERAGGDELLVLGRHGTRRFRDLVIGSTAERVIRALHVPVLIVTGAPRRPYRRPLVAVDLSPASGLALRAAARVLAPDVGITVVHVYQTAHDALLRRVARPEGLARYLRRCREEVVEEVGGLLRSSVGADRVRGLLLRRGDPRTAILRTLRAQRADLVAVGSHGRAPLAGALVGSVAEGVIRHATCDTLVAHP